MWSPRYEQIRSTAQHSASRLPQRFANSQIILCTGTVLIWMCDVEKEYEKINHEKKRKKKRHFIHATDFGCPIRRILCTIRPTFISASWICPNKILSPTGSAWWAESEIVVPAITNLLNWDTFRTRPGNPGFKVDNGGSCSPNGSPTGHLKLKLSQENFRTGTLTRSET